MKWLKKLFGKSQIQEIRTHKKSKPSNWDLTITDLFDEIEVGKRKSISAKEGEWAREYERSLIPKGVRYPKKYDLYKARKDQLITYMTAWEAPYTGDGEAIFYKDELIWINDEPGDKPIGAYALPVEYNILEKRMVPRYERDNSQYNGFYFFINTRELDEKFILVQTNFTG